MELVKGETHNAGLRGKGRRDSGPVSPRGGSLSRSQDIVSAAALALSVEDAGREAWDRFVEKDPQASAYHLWGWREVIEMTFGHQGHYLLARREGEACGALPLVLMKSLLFGRLLCSLPYLNYGGYLAADRDVEEALLERAVVLAQRLRCSSIELRHVELTPRPAVAKQHKVAMVLELASDEETQWMRLDHKVRNQVRKAHRSGLTCLVDPENGLEEFYAVFARNMRDLGTPVYPMAFFQNVRRAFPGRTRLLVVRMDRIPIAAAFLFSFRDRMEMPWASSVRDFNHLSPNNLLYWEAIRHSIQSGARNFDMGRCTPKEGSYHFKKQWGAEAVPLHWQYWLREGEPIPEYNTKNRKFSLPIKVWKKLPLVIAGFLGPHLTRGLP